jgi:hypothetical protein
MKEQELPCHKLSYEDLIRQVINRQWISSRNKDGTKITLVTRKIPEAKYTNERTRTPLPCHHLS